MSATIPGPDGRPRCRWCAAAPEFFSYHDREWGFPVVNDIRLFEKLCLESFQSGLSWRTILSKRENFRAAFAGFDFRKVAEFDEADVARLLADAGIVRHRGKIEAVINNARRACDMVEAEGSLAAFLWRFEPLRPPRRCRRNCSGAAGNSSARRPSMPSCRRWDWSTTMQRAASCAPKPSSSAWCCDDPSILWSDAR